MKIQLSGVSVADVTAARVQKTASHSLPSGLSCYPMHSSPRPPSLHHPLPPLKRQQGVRRKNNTTTQKLLMLMSVRIRREELMRRWLTLENWT